MKIILSRKGFDSEHGGYPSPVLPDGRMVSLPIPREDNLGYGDLRFGDETYLDLMRQLNHKIRDNGKCCELTRNTKCHLDPDIREDVIPRYKGWRACFGQVGAAQTHLDNRDVQVGDLFLFFGWFRETIMDEAKDESRNKTSLRFCGSDLHAIFGYMQIGEIISRCDENYREPIWMRGHPHLLEKRRKLNNNNIYIANDRLTWNDDIPGAGTFRFDRRLVLTKAGLTRSRWELPDFFRFATISHHSEDSWREDYFQSAAIGQEFVVEPLDQVISWAKTLIDNCKADMPV